MSFISAVFGLLVLIRSPRGRAGRTLWLPKLWAGAWAPFLAIAGGLGALFGLMRRDKTVVWTGLFGAFAGWLHTFKVTRPHKRFEFALGPDWEQRIRPEQWERLSPPYEFIPPQLPPPRVRNAVRLGNTSLSCDLWTPPEGISQSKLGLIYLRDASQDALTQRFMPTRNLFTRLTNQGHVVMDLLYRSPRNADLSIMLGDVKHAIVWFKEHAREYGVNPKRIVLMGASGGGQLALLAGYTSNDPQMQPVGMQADTSVRAVISLYGVTDLGAQFQEHNNLEVPDLQTLLPLVEQLSGTPDDEPKRYRLFSPISHVNRGCPPTLQIFGDDDVIVNASQGQRLHSALQQAGITSIYVELPDTVHAFGGYPGVSPRLAPAAQVTVNDVEQFLALMV